PGLLPLRVGEPLQVLLEHHLARQLAAGAIDGGRFPALQRLGPLGPGLFTLVGMDRAKNRVILDPPRLLAEKRLEAAGALGVPAPLGLVKACERPAKRDLFQTADVRVLDPRRAPHRFQQLLLLGAETVLAAERRELGHGPKRD